MGRRYEESKKRVAENKKTLEGLNADKAALEEEYSPMEFLDMLQGLLDDEVTDSIQTVKSAGDSEKKRIEAEEATAKKEKTQIAGEIISKIATLNSGLEKLQKAENVKFGKKEVEQSRREYKKQISKFNELLNELETTSTADFESVKSSVSAEGKEALAAFNENSDNYEETDTSGMQIPVDLKLSALNYSTAFIVPEEFEITQKLTSFINSIPDSDKRVLNLYNNIGKLEHLHEKSIPFSIIHEERFFLRRKPSDEPRDDVWTVESVELSVPELTGENITGQVQTTLHEQMHLIDYLLNENVKDIDVPFFSTSNSSISETIRNVPSNMGSDIQELFSNFHKNIDEIESALNSEYYTSIGEANLKLAKDNDLEAYNTALSKAKETLIKKLDYESRNAMGGGINQLEDIYDALSGGVFRDSDKVAYGHGSEYYKNENSRINEIIANYASLSITRPDLTAMLKKDKPQLVSALDSIIDSMNERIMRHDFN